MGKVKGCLVVPQGEEWRLMQQPLRALSDRSDGGSMHLRRGDRGERLASSRVGRDNLMREMEAIVLQEAELGSALEWLDYTRQRCNLQHDEIVRRLEHCEEMLRGLERGGVADDAVEELLSDEERVRWRKSKEMVTTVLPEVLTRLEDNIELNNAKIREVRDKMEELRAKRLALREEIAVKEEDIELALSGNAV
ncbi:unnamed protein product [Phytophthora fragariaefolia]|uniref:Unnamed protein product n=1 Tax=Phytophthora fragariaefolia TaxID=1490495 RepID=A0A9W7CND8_9STRA|nr:unnamed protein product [Phytophthora fragariaefolia]